MAASNEWIVPAPSSDAVAPSIDPSAPVDVTLDPTDFSAALGIAEEVCGDLFAPRPKDVRAPGERAPAFIRPWTLLLDAKVDGGIHSAFASDVDKIVTAKMREHYRMRRFRYVKPCNPVGADPPKPTVASLVSHAPTRVEFVLSPRITEWREKEVKTTVTDANGNTKTVDGWEIEADATVVVYRVEGAVMTEYAKADVSVPSFLDSITFFVSAATDSALSAFGSGPEFPDTRHGRFLEATDKIVERLAQKLAVETKKMDRFRLVAPVIEQHEDRASFALGIDEGVALDDTYVIVPAGGTIDDWEGFGRVRDIGAGGKGGHDAPSELEVIAEGEGGAQAVMEWPQIGIEVYFSGAMNMASHPAARAEGSATELSANAVAAGAGVGAAYRVGFGLISELYFRSDVSFLFDGAPAFLLTVDPGLEKRWSWGRVTPSVGAKLAMSFYSFSTGNQITNKKGKEVDQSAGAKSMGLVAYLGLGVMLHPDVSLRATAGWRQHFGALSEFKDQNDNVVRIIDDNGQPYEVSLSGPNALATFEYTF